MREKLHKTGRPGKGTHHSLEDLDPEHSFNVFWGVGHRSVDWGVNTISPRWIGVTAAVLK